MPKRRTPLAFTIRIVPRTPQGYEVTTSPHHLAIEETVEEVVRGRVSLRDDRPTVITASVDAALHPWSDGPIAPTRVRYGLLQLAEVGAEDLRHIDRIVTGYLYDAVTSAVLGSMHERGFATDGSFALELDDGPIPQLRTATYSWWRDVRHVIVAHDGGTTVRLRGIPRSDPFAEWGNARILTAFRKRLAAALGVPAASIPAHTRTQAV